MLGYRSGLEEKIGKQLDDLQVEYTYETEKISYVQPAKKRTYKPDFIKNKKNGEKLYIETKGYWPPAERKKMEYIKQSNPTLDIRMVFSNPNNKISKTSKTTYGDVATKLGIPFAAGTIPIDWLSE